MEWWGNGGEMVGKIDLRGGDVIRKWWGIIFNIWQNKYNYLFEANYE